MSNYIYFSPEEKARAQNTDLVSLLRAQGERPIRSGREYRTPNDPSVTVRGNKWFDHSARVGGYAVSFVQRYYRLSYQEAVLLLLGRKDGKRYEQAQPAPTEPKPFALPDPYDNNGTAYGCHGAGTGAHSRRKYEPGGYRPRHRGTWKAVRSSATGGFQCRGCGGISTFILWNRMHVQNTTFA